MRSASINGAPDFRSHALPIIEIILQACFRLLVALAVAAIGAGAFLALALASEAPSKPEPILKLPAAFTVAELDNRFGSSKSGECGYSSMAQRLP